MSLPAIVARGIRDGPTVGITAAVHGNELNGEVTQSERIKAFKIDTVYRVLFEMEQALKSTSSRRYSSYSQLHAQVRPK